MDFVAGGVVSTVGAGLFTGLAPAAGLAGSWVLAGFVLAAGLGLLVVLSTSDRPLETARVPVRRLAFGLGALGRLAAAVAAAGTFGEYVGAESASPFWAVGLVAVVTVVAVVAPRLPALVVRVAAVVVLGSLAVVALACFAIDPVAPAVAVDGGGSVLGLVAGAGLLTVCFLGVAPVPKGARVVEVHLPTTEPPPEPPDAGPRASTAAVPVDRAPDGAGVGPEVAEVPVEGAPDDVPRSGVEPDESSAAGERAAGRGGVPVGGAPDDSPLEFGVGRAAVRAWRFGVVAVFAVVLVGCLAVGAGVLRQLGAPRLALSPTPLLDALAAADASALEPLVLAGVAVATGFVTLGILRRLAADSGPVPAVRVNVAAGTVVAVGAVVVAASTALVAAAVLLLGDAALRLVAVRHRRLG